MPTVTLSFDNGPDPDITPQVLDILARRGVRTTFFVMGRKLAEPALRGGVRTPAVVPSSGDAARRLGWTTTKFNRKLDNVCQKFAAQGVRGLHGDPGRLASNRRARLVEYALSTRVVIRDDLDLLEAVAPPGPERGLAPVVDGDDAID